MSSVANKIVLNTVILYVKMFLTVGITLYTSRVVLNALGATDFGIFNLVAGVIVLLSFLNTAMATSTQRYLSVSQGGGLLQEQKSVFTNSLILHLFLAGILSLIFLIVGLFLFDGLLNIPEDRIPIAKTIYYFSIITMSFSIISVPFIASLNAHENMLGIALVNVVEVFLKLGIALSIPFFKGDRLVYYGMMLTLVGFVSLILYSLFCVLKYDECSFKVKGRIDLLLIKKLASFSIWNLFGAASALGRVQGLAIVLNVFLGAIVNAAYGIANQIASQLSFFSTTMLRVLNPQLMKSEGAGDRDRMLRLTILASKYGFAFLAFLAIPCVFEMEIILRLWLKNVPEYTVVFCQLILITSLVNQLSVGLQSAIQAVGNIKAYQITNGLLLLCNLPVSVIVLKLGFPAYCVLGSMIIFDSLALLLRLYHVKMKCNLKVKDYLNSVVVKVIIPTILSIVVCFFIIYFNDTESFKRLVIVLFLSSVSFVSSFYFLSLDSTEKFYINSIVKNVRNKFLSKGR